MCSRYRSDVGDGALGLGNFCRYSVLGLQFAVGSTQYSACNMCSRVCRETRSDVEGVAHAALLTEDRKDMLRYFGTILKKIREVPNSMHCAKRFLIISQFGAGSRR